MANLNIQYLLQGLTTHPDKQVQKIAEAIMGIVDVVKELDVAVSEGTTQGTALVDIPYNISYIPDYRIPKQRMKLTGNVNVAATLGIDEYSTILFFFEADGTNRLVQMSIAYQTTVPLTFTVNANCFSVLEFQGHKDSATGAIRLRLINSLYNQPI